MKIRKKRIRQIIAEAIRVILESDNENKPLPTMFKDDDTDDISYSELEALLSSGPSSRATSHDSELEKYKEMAREFSKEDYREFQKLHDLWEGYDSIFDQYNALIATVTVNIFDMMKGKVFTSDEFCDIFESSFSNLAKSLFLEQFIPHVKNEKVKGLLAWTVHNIIAHIGDFAASLFGEMTYQEAYQGTLESILKKFSGQIPFDNGLKIVDPGPEIKKEISKENVKDEYERSKKWYGDDYTFDEFLSNGSSLSTDIHSYLRAYSREDPYGKDIKFTVDENYSQEKVAKRASERGLININFFINKYGADEFFQELHRSGQVEIEGFTHEEERVNQPGLDAEMAQRALIREKHQELTEIHYELISIAEEIESYDENDPNIHEALDLAQEIIVFMASETTIEEKDNLIFSSIEETNKLIDYVNSLEEN